VSLPLLVIAIVVTPLSLAVVSLSDPHIADIKANMSDKWRWPPPSWAEDRPAPPPVAATAVAAPAHGASGEAVTAAADDGQGDSQTTMGTAAGATILSSRMPSPSPSASPSPAAPAAPMAASPSSATPPRIWVMYWFAKHFPTIVALHVMYLGFLEAATGARDALTGGASSGDDDGGSDAAEATATAAATLPVSLDRDLLLLPRLLLIPAIALSLSAHMLASVNRTRALFPPDGSVGWITAALVAAAVTLTSAGAVAAMAAAATDRALARSVIAHLPVYPVVLACVWPLCAIAVVELVKRSDAVRYRRFQMRIRLISDTRLGMHSPI
jgi:hypothetical protein